MRTESQDYKGFEIQVAHNPPMWQASIFYPKSPRAFPVNRALQRISCQIKGDAFAKARERIDEVLKTVALKIRVAFGPQHREGRPLMLLARASLQSEAKHAASGPKYVERCAACTDSQSQIEEARRRNEHISSPNLRLVVQNDVQQRTVDLDTSVVPNEAEFSICS